MEMLILVLGAIVAIVGLILVLTVYSSFSWGFVLYKFWYWFLLPVFPNLTHVSFWHCVGLTFFIGLFKNNNTASYLKDESKKTQDAIMPFVYPWIIVLVGYFFYLIIR